MEQSGATDSNSLLSEAEKGVGKKMAYLNALGRVPETEAAIQQANEGIRAHIGE